MQIQISWLLKKPTDLDLHCLLTQGMSCSAREGLRMFLLSKHPESVVVGIMLQQTVHCDHVVEVLQARRNEKEMKVKPATSFKLLTIFIHKKIRQDSK